MKLDLIIKFLFMMVIFLGGFVSAAFYYDSNEPKYEIKDVSDCSNKSLIDTTNCLRDWVQTFYNYTKESENNLTLEQLKEFGGNCEDYTLLYQEIFENYGFLTKKLNIYPKEGAGHTFLIVWDKELTAYCKVDMLYVNCMKFEK